MCTYSFIFNVFSLWAQCVSAGRLSPCPKKLQQMRTPLFNAFVSRFIFYFISIWPLVSTVFGLNSLKIVCLCYKCSRKWSNKSTKLLTKFGCNYECITGVWYFVVPLFVQPSHGKNGIALFTFTVDRALHGQTTRHPMQFVICLVHHTY